MNFRRKSALLAAVCFALGGCGKGPEIVPFTGKVLYKGEPLEFGSVMFQPTAGGKPSSGRIESDGTFAMKTRGVGDGAAVGLNRIRVTCFPAQKPGAGGNQSQEIALGNSLIPTRYNSFGSSGLSIEVKAAGNDPYTIELDDP